jgi:Kef-type K+ transport system membrane component KefB
MRWTLGLVALGLTMALFNVVTATASLEARATLALGFLVLAGALVGALAQRLGLPRITGYLAAGILAGPDGLALVRADEVGALRFLFDAAVALVALAAGAAAKTLLLRRHARALVRSSAGAIAAPLLAVTAFVLVTSGWFPLTVNQPWGDRLTIALTLGAVAAASAPAVTLALMDQLVAHGPLPQLLLTLTIVKDVAVILVVTLVLGLGGLLGSSGAVDPDVLWRTPLQLLGSAAAGAVLGWTAARYLRVQRGDAALFLVGFALLAAWAARLMGLDVLIIGLAAGCLVTNVTHALPLSALRRGSEPVYLLLFVLAGAAVSLPALGAVWPWVLLVAGVRALGLRYGMRWAGRDVSVPPWLAQGGWVGLLPLAGVALGLAATVRRAFPEWGVSLEAFVLAMIGVHEVLGPVLARRALVQVGDQEARNAESGAADSSADVPGGVMGGVL